LPIAEVFLYVPCVAEVKIVGSWQSAYIFVILRVLSDLVAELK